MGVKWLVMRVKWLVMHVQEETRSMLGLAYQRMSKTRSRSTLKRGCLSFPLSLVKTAAVG